MHLGLESDHYCYSAAVGKRSGGHLVDSSPRDSLPHPTYISSDSEGRF